MPNNQKLNLILEETDKQVVCMLKFASYPPETLLLFWYNMLVNGMQLIKINRWTDFVLIFGFCSIDLTGNSAQSSTDLVFS